jgi:hypothetical protein
MINHNEKDNMEMDETGLIIVNPIDAESLVKADPECADVLLITTFIENEHAILVYEKDFLEFIETKGECFAKE